ncbi:MAG: type II toxin-antitoxin system VapC family toxin [Archaeoglobaceae archaeon]
MLVNSEVGVKLQSSHNELVREAVGRATDFITNVCKVEQMENILPPAFKLALKNEITVYDALFIKLAIDLDGVMVTTDRKLSNKINESSISKFADCVS